MKFICEKSTLDNLITTAQKAVDTKSTNILLEGILFIAENNSLTLISNNIEMAISTKANTDIIEEGSIVINAKMVGDIIRKFPDCDITFESKENFDVKIYTEKSEFILKGMDPTGFPPIPEIKEGEAVVLSSSELREAIRQTIFAVSTDETRKILTGMLLESTEAGMVMVAVDGIRMALRNIEAVNNNSNFSVVIPSKTMSELYKIITDTDINIQIMEKNNQILFSYGDTNVVSRLLEGKYLNYKNLSMVNWQSQIMINKEQLLSSLERTILSYSEANKYSIKLNIDTNLLTITVNSSIINLTEELDIELEGNKMKISFNPRMMYEIIRVINDDMLYMQMCTAMGPCTIKPVDNDKFVYTIAAVKSGS